MHALSDLVLWRLVFMLALVAALLVGVALWHAGRWLRGRIRAARRTHPARSLRIHEARV